LILGGRRDADRRSASQAPPDATPPLAERDDAAWCERLREALATDRLVLHFQPILSLRAGTVSHHEALLRLADADGGELLAPAAFLPAAERTGLIREIDRAVVEKVVALLAGSARRDGRDAAPTLAVNVSALSVSDGELLSCLQRALDRHRADPGRLVVELTETAAIADMRRAREFCAAVEGLGCAIALDDFGAGFGSFQYLKQLPFTYLKIDGEFIRGLRRSRTDQLVVRALVDVVRGMGRRTIAEFVADAETIDLLRGFGVDYAQGFEVGRPRPLVPVPA
jgi:EAL domain-containing protein (putative c-di-GMP-specific phosphodiesterase class I)